MNGRSVLGSRLGAPREAAIGTVIDHPGQVLVCGIDAGATKTDCAICDGDGRLLARALSGASPILGSSDDFARELARVVRTAAKQATIDSEDVGVFVVGLAGVDTDGGRERALASFRRALPTQSVLVENDAANALEACTSERPAAVLMAGTGSIAYAEDEDRNPYRAGGFGHLFSDEGSGFKIGVDGLGAVIRAADGRGDATALTERACGLFGLGDARELVDRTALFARDPSLIAGFAPDVCEAAADGDAVAALIVEGAAADLVKLAVRLGDKLDLDGALIALAGGLLLNGRGYADSVERALTKAFPHTVLRRAELPPVVGALLKGLALAGGLLDFHAVRDSLVASFSQHPTVELA